MSRTPRYKLLLIDVDGTLVGKDSTISEENLAALRAANEVGVRISICTGRSMLSSRAQIEALGFDGFHAFYDGGFICKRASREVLHAGVIEPELVRRVVDFAREHDFYLELSNGFESFAELSCPVQELKTWAFDAKHATRSLKGIEDEETIVQGLIVTPSDDDRKETEAFVTELGPQLLLGYGPSGLTPGLNAGVLVHGETSKGSAIARFCEYHGFTPDEVMAVGDWMNDIEMLQAAGLGVAMGQAPDEVKAAADCVTASIDEHGLAEAIKKYLLG